MNWEMIFTILGVLGGIPVLAIIYKIRCHFIRNNNETIETIEDPFTVQTTSEIKAPLNYFYKWQQNRVPGLVCFSDTTSYPDENSDKSYWNGLQWITLAGDCYEKALAVFAKEDTQFYDKTLKDDNLLSEFCTLEHAKKTVKVYSVNVVNDKMEITSKTGTILVEGVALDYSVWLTNENDNTNIKPLVIIHRNNNRTIDIFVDKYN